MVAGFLRKTSAVGLDLLLVVTSVAVLYALTGGGAFRVLDQRVSIRSADNPLVVFSMLWCVRFACRRWAPFLGVRGWEWDRFWTRCDDLVRWWRSAATNVPVRRWAVALLVVAIALLAVKLAFARLDPGFYSGDDVEVHEMSLGVLLSRAFSIWDLRSPVFPMLFVFPAQWVTYHLGGSGTSLLVLAGRVVVAVMSTISVFVLWRAARRLWPSSVPYAALAALLFATAKLSMAFGSSELPRPVATLFVLIGFLLVQRPRASSSMGAAMVIAIAASLRFSEAIFVVPAVLQLILMRQRSLAVLFGATSVFTFVFIQGAADWLYWGEPFHSAVAAFDFTLLSGLSSRGYQPPWWYLTSLGTWTTLPIFIFAVIGTLRRPVVGVWMWIPLVALSVLPHKEPRYLIPTVAFVSLTAAAGIQVMLEKSRPAGAPLRTAFVLSGLLLGLLHDAAHWRLPRTNTDVALAANIGESQPLPRAISVQQMWRMGGHLYLPPIDLHELEPTAFDDAGYVRSHTPDGSWVYLDRRTARQGSTIVRVLEQRGFRELPPTDASSYALWTQPGVAPPDYLRLQNRNR